MDDYELLSDDLEYLVGLRTDTADAGGSLHAKMGALPKAKGMLTKGSFSTANTSLQTALSVTGKGNLKNLMAKNSASGVYYGVAKITLDGAVLFWGQLAQSNVAMQEIDVGLLFANTQNGGVVEFITALTGSAAGKLDWDFNASLLIELRSNVGGNTATVYWLYSAE